jgi:hypothetical protein
MILDVLHVECGKAPVITVTVDCVAAGNLVLQGQCETGVCKPSVDCVGAFGDFGACSNVCGTGQKTKVYSIVSHATQPMLLLLRACCCKHTVERAIGELHSITFGW